METATTVRELIDILEEHGDHVEVVVSGRHDEHLVLEVDDDPNTGRVVITGGLPFDA